MCGIRPHIGNMDSGEMDVVEATCDEDGGANGMIVAVDKVGWCNLKSVMKASGFVWFQRLNIQYDKMISSLAFKFCFQFQLAPLQQGAEGWNHSEGLQF